MRVSCCAVLINIEWCWGCLYRIATIRMANGHEPKRFYLSILAICKLQFQAITFESRKHQLNASDAHWIFLSVFFHFNEKTSSSWLNQSMKEACLILGFFVSLDNLANSQWYISHSKAFAHGSQHATIGYISQSFVLRKMYH